MKKNVFKDPFSFNPEEVAQIEKRGLGQLMGTDQLIVPKKMPFVITISLESEQKLPDLSLFYGVPFYDSSIAFELNQDWIKLSIGTEATTKKILSTHRAMLIADYDLEKRDKLMDDLALFMSKQDVFSFVIQV